MSLFTSRALWSTRCGGGDRDSFDQCSMVVVASLTGAGSGQHGEYLLVGSHKGLLHVYRPSNAKMGYRAEDLLMETQLQHPILQLATGKLVSGTQNVQVGVLHPRSLAVYSLVARTGATEHGSHHQLALAYEHRLRRSAHSMLVGGFGGSRARDFVCVQSLDGALSVFEQESPAFEAFLPCFLIPQPLVYLGHTDSILTQAADYTLHCYRYSCIAECAGAEEGGGGRRLIPEWTYGVGEAALLDLQEVTWSSSHVDVLLLAARSLTCIREDGSLRFSKRLDYAASCFHPYITAESGKLMTLVASESNTLLVYEGTTLRWSSQLDLCPVAVRRINLQGLQGVLVLLSDEGQLQCCYLGTEPSLFMPPPLEVSEIDYQEAGRELHQLHKVISSYSKDNTAHLVESAADRELEVSVTLGCDLESSCRVRVCVALRPHVPLAKVQVSVVVQPPLLAARVTHSVASLCEPYQTSTSVFRDGGGGGGDVSCLEVRVVTSYMTGSRGVPRVVHRLVQLPLTLVYKVSSAAVVEDDAAACKITVNTDRPTVSLTELFPEFPADEGATCLSLLYSGDVTVTVLTSSSGKSGGQQRYRVQGERLPALYLLAETLLERLRRRFRKDGDDWSCGVSSTQPSHLHELTEALQGHFLCTRTATHIQEELAQRASQFRVIQRRLLTKLKSKTPTALTSLDALLRDTHAKLLASLDLLERAQTDLALASARLSCALRLTHLSTAALGGSAELAAALNPAAVVGSDPQGWEETTETALSFLLRTSLARSVRDRQRSTPLSLAPLRDTSRLRKHLASCLDRASRPTQGITEQDYSSNVGISPIPESALEEDAAGPLAVVPAGSRLAETRPKLLLARARRREPTTPGKGEEQMAHLEPEGKPPVESLQSTEEDDQW